MCTPENYSESGHTTLCRTNCARDCIHQHLLEYVVHIIISTKRLRWYIGAVFSPFLVVLPED
jgi:hypothetical protein